MKINKALIKRLYKQVNDSKMHSRFNHSPCVAIICGPSIVLEVVVQTAKMKSGIDMDWCYFGGRGCVHAIGDVVKAKEALRSVMPAFC